MRKEGKGRGVGWREGEEGERREDKRGSGSGE